MLAARQRAAALHKAGRSQLAAVELARYKKLGSLVGKLRGAVVNLLSIHYSIEGVAADVAVFSGLTEGNAALRAQNREAAGVLAVKDVDEALAEARELMAETQAVSEALAQSPGTAAGGAQDTEGEEAALLAELAALEREEQEQEAAAVAAALPGVAHLPAPTATAAAPATAAEAAATPALRGGDGGRKREAVPS